MPDTIPPEESPDIPAGRVATIINRIEDGFLVSLLVFMIGLAFLQIVLRNGFDSGIIWADGLIRILVLWIGLVGAMVASRNGNHINIDIVTKYLPHQVKNVVESVVALFTILVCGVVAWYSLDFIRFEFEDGSQAFAGIPAWICEVIIPVAFSVISLRYLFLFYTSLKKAVRDHR